MKNLNPLTPDEWFRAIMDALIGETDKGKIRKLKNEFEKLKRENPEWTKKHQLEREYKREADRISGEQEVFESPDKEGMFTWKELHGCDEADADDVHDIWNEIIKPKNIYEVYYGIYYYTTLQRFFRDDPGRPELMMAPAHVAELKARYKKGMEKLDVWLVKIMKK